jgi:cardiolipin synthase
VWITVMIVVLGLFMAQMITVLFVEYRKPSKTVAWLTIMIFIPVIGSMLYYYLARSYKQRRKVKRYSGQISIQTRAYFTTLAHLVHPMGDRDKRIRQERTSELNEQKEQHEQKELNKQEEMNEETELDLQVVLEHYRMFAYLGSLDDAPMTSHNEITIFADCHETYTAMLAAISEAVDHIHLQFYTIRSDRVGRCFQSLLIAKALTNVKVRVLYDGLGSYNLEQSFISEMQQAGIEVFSFLPPFIAFFDKQVNYRNHRKMLIVDGKVGFMGGMNIGEEYVGGNQKLGYWRDTHLKLKGDAVYNIQNIFMSDWSLSTGQAISELPRYYPEHTIQGREVVQMITSGPDQQANSILEMFFASISSATSSIYLTSPYYIPDPSITMALKTAAMSGLDVRMIIPFKADSELVQWASLSYMEEILQAGVKCYLYQKGFIHAKVLIVDKMMATVGSANMDMRSFFSNFELNAVLFAPSTIATLLQNFREDQNHSIKLELQDVINRSRLQRIKEVAARLLSPLL